VSSLVLAVICSLRGVVITAEILDVRPARELRRSARSDSEVLGVSDISTSAMELPSSFAGVSFLQLLQLLQAALRRVLGHSVKAVDPRLG
jgi:hypothetical protein